MIALDEHKANVFKQHCVSVLLLLPFLQVHQHVVVCDIFIILVS